MLKTALVLFSILLCGCAATTAPEKPTPPPAPVKGKAAIYIFNASAIVFKEYYGVSIADREIGALPARTYTRVDCAPGSYKVAVEGSPFVRVSLAADEVVCFKFAAEPEGIKAVALGQRSATSVIPPPLLKIDAKQAAQLLRNYDRAENAFGK